MRGSIWSVIMPNAVPFTVLIGPIVGTARRWGLAQPDLGQGVWLAAPLLGGVAPVVKTVRGARP